MPIKRIINQVFKSPMLFTVCINGILAILALVSGSLAAHLLGVSGRGDLAAIQLWPNFLASISLLGLSEAIVYFISKENQNAGRIFSSAISLTLMLSIPFMVLGYFLIPILLSSQTPTIIAASRIYLLMIPLLSLAGLPLQAIRGRNDMIIWNIMRVIQPLGWVVVLLFLSIRGQNSPTNAAYAYLCLVGFLILPTAYIFYRRIPGPMKVDRQLWRPMLRFGLPSIATSFPSILNLRMDQMLMAAFLSPQTLGLYVVAVAWAGAVSPLINAISIIIFPRVAAQTTSSERIQALTQGIHLAVLVGFFIIIILLAITPIALPLIFGKDFTPAIPASLILVVAGVISSLNGVLEDGSRGLGKPSIALKSESTGLAFTILSLALLLRPLGIIGASISSLLGYSGTLIALLFQISKSVDLNLKLLLIPNRSDLTRILIRFQSLVGAS